MNIENTTPPTGESSLWRATFNTTSALLGIGIIAIPYAVAKGGWVSLGICIVIAMMACYTGTLLKACIDIDPSISTYLDIVHRAFGSRWRTVAAVFLNTELYLVALSLIMAESDNLCKLFPKLARRTFVLITGGITFPTVLITDLSIFSYVSITGVMSTLVIVGSLVYLGISKVGFHAEQGISWNTGGIPTAISFYIFCFAGHPVLPSIYMSIRHRHQFVKVLMTSFLVTVTTCLVTAVIGYLMYGGGVQSQVTLNLPTSETGSKIAIYTTLLIPITRYTLMISPVASAIHGLLSHKYQNRTSIEIAIRILILASNTFLAFFFPYFETLMGLLGSIFVVSASFLLPSACYLRLSHAYNSWNCKFVATLAIMVFGVIAGVLGTYISISDLVKH